MICVCLSVCLSPVSHVMLSPIIMQLVRKQPKIDVKLCELMLEQRYDGDITVILLCYSEISSNFEEILCCRLETGKSHHQTELCNA